MNTLPALTAPHFNLSKFIATGFVATIVTFVLFVAMQKLINNDQVRVTKVTEHFPITLTYEIKEKTLIERVKIKPKPAPLPKPKLIAKVTDSDPDVGFNATMQVANIGVPMIKNNIKADFDSDGGDARPIVRVEPKYPAIAAKEGIEGWVKLSFSVTPSGTVNNIKVLDSQPKRIFNQAAKRALAKWKYKPSIQAGKAQSQDGMMVMLDFKLAS